MWSLLLLIPAAFPQTGGLDAHGFSVADHPGDPRGWLELASPDPGWQGSWDAGIVFDGSDDPLVETVGDQTYPILDQLLAANLVASASIQGIARIGVAVPTYPLGYDQKGAFAAMGDIRLDAVVPMLRLHERTPGISIIPAVWVPSGTASRYLGDSGVGLGATLAVAQYLGRLGWGLNVGGRFGRREEVRNVTWGSGLLAGAGLSWLVQEDASVGAELHATPTYGLAEEQFPVEALVHGRVRLPLGLWAQLGGGSGLTGGVGASRYRVVMGIGWCEPGIPPVEDKDLDGLDDKVDTCPLDPEDRDGFEDTDGCPDPDHDRDGIPDIQDRCVTEAEDPDGVQDDDGCPEIDADQDGIPDGSDACPTEPEDMDGNADHDGCPEPDPDTDGDGVPDFRDACPDVPLRAGQDPRTSDGCPHLAEISDNKIVITDFIYFEEGKARLLPESFAVLGSVAQVLKEHPEVTDVLVEGHTNDVGDDDYNYRLSEARASAVKEWLITHGVDRNRLASKGYGESRPLVPNETDADRALNRRVEFTIVSRIGSP